MKKIPLVRWLPVLMLPAFLTVGSLRTAGQENGIFADFTTSMGNFTCQIYFTNAPMASANFIGLATGNRPWLDEPSGAIRTNAFFNGLLFHRVIANFMIQSGSPNGLGNDGPGYVVPDEIDPLLTHDGPGVLSMANSGPNSSGSQFFITAVETPWLNGIHTVFGRVVSGLEVVLAINNVPTNPDSNRPLTDVIIQSVTIRRVGALAEAFDIHAQSLPVVSSEPLGIAGQPGQITLHYTLHQYASLLLGTSTNLTTWIPTELSIPLSPTALDILTLPTDLPAQFFRMSRVQYPSSTFAPPSLREQILILIFNNNLGTLAITFDAANAGTYTYTASPPGSVQSYTWTQLPYRGYLWPISFTGLPTMGFRLDFENATGGSFIGTVAGYGSVSGTFTLSPP